MKQAALLLVTALWLAACGQDGEPQPAASAASPATESAAVDGAMAYEQYCATCHETGMLGAPQMGAPADWEGRSTLWQAVLMEHARTGYFDMPARGGNSELPDDIVNAAAEYMLEQTFPERAED